ncbi:phenylacetate--CoA ligase family protein [Winogradskyella aquimaris]|uniref:CoF synthetase n=1 Tax=Winogradskyella aquimaris TaxID=864074 RepID=A0ABU5EMB1_9FLAO|nr:CoF synthetase [Winogradskyella aquimaris]MDY2587575.1 CoF synthetase [Winogradskyella aquimaris]
MSLREHIFWFLDNLKGQPFKKLFIQTKDILESKNIEWVEAENTKQLKKLIAHATQTTSFYSNKGFNHLQDFPVINKNCIREDYDAFLSSKFNKVECREVFTSGSTGSPFRIYHNKEKVQKINADNIWFSSQANYSIGYPLIFIRAWLFKLTPKIKFDYFKKNITTVSTFEVVENGVEKFIEKLNSKGKVLSFMMYGSTLEYICKYLDSVKKNPIKFKTRSIITISDALTPYAKEAAQKHFGITPLSRYSNTESGIIAQQLFESRDYFRINNSSFVIEIFDLEKDVLVPNGQVGRIVITDLYNFAMPLIRYDTGDLGAMTVDAHGISFLSQILGRKLDQLFNTKGKLLPSLFMSSKLNEFGEFKQYQIVQKSKIEYHINLNTDKEFEAIKLTEYYKSYFGEDAIVKVNLVNDIPLLSSGKRRQVVNEYYN